jgi:hypothetical protein
MEEIVDMAIEKNVLGQLLAGHDPQGLFGKNGLLDKLKKTVSERMLPADLDDHLENEGPGGTINRRNGSSRKTMLRGIEGDAGRAARPSGDVRPQAHRQVPAPFPRFRRQDHLDECARHDGARDPRAP